MPEPVMSSTHQAAMASLRPDTGVHRGAPPKAAQRADIQALRAIAVVLVVAYHFFPGRIPGGFIGVDVFFVISGFLITTHLLSRPPRSGRDLAEFWGRRIRRLLPAAFLVLVVTFAGTVLWAPQTIWANVAKQIAAAGLYVENWFLAGQAVDYLAADDAASPVQHFWSLSVEEQFYLVWPLLILLAFWIAARRRSEARRLAGVVVGAVVAASFLASLWITTTDPASAYFVSWTRAWELGLGGLAACIFPWVQKRLAGKNLVRVVIAYVGLAMLVASAFILTGAMPFPGWIAAIPVVGTALIILAAVEHGRLSPLPAMSWKPVQLTGDLSYSLYLWHWPALILLPYVIGHSLHRGEKLLVIVAAFALAWLTKTFVEDRLRGSKPLGRPLRRSYGFAVVGMAVIVAMSMSVIGVVSARAASAEAKIEHELNDPSSCFGSRALVNSSECTPHGASLTTDPVFAASDQPAPYSDGCWVLGDFSDQKTCHYGSSAADAKKVALIGNSHAGHWLPALQQIAKTENWSITTYLISECYTVDVPIAFETAERTQNCLDWNKKAVSQIADGGYDLVVISNRTSRSMPGMDLKQTFTAAEKSYTRVLDRWLDADTPVLVLRDTPYATDLANVPDCVAAHRDDLSACDGTSARKQTDPLADAADKISNNDLGVLDLTDRFCSNGVCYSTIGGVIVYFDRGHMSATFARSLAPDIKKSADALLSRAAK